LGLNLDTTATKIDNNTFLDSILYCRCVERSDMEINGKAGYGYAADFLREMGIFTKLICFTCWMIE
jgi:hypothetical protein